MPDKILPQGQGLELTDKTYYLDLGNGTYALVHGAVLAVNDAAVSSVNPLPVTVARFVNPLPVVVANFVNPLPVNLANVTMDPHTNGLAMIDVPHYMVHIGDSYVCQILTTNTVSLCFRVPAGMIEPHLTVMWAAESKATFQLWEGRTWTAQSGTLQTLFNRNRNSANESVLQENETSGAFQATGKLVLTPTLQANGTLLDTGRTWSDKRETFTSRETEEFPLRRDETYVVLLTSDDGATKGTHLILNWYEVED